MAIVKKKKKVVKKKKARAPAADEAETAVPQVRVRMFRQGLGDCFLVTFDVGGDERHMLIDCGTLGSSADEADKVKVADIAAHLLETIGEEGRLHIVVATHEHQDHLSGFNNKEMQKLQDRVDHVWLAWTENPIDPDAQKFVIFTKDLGEALALVAEAAPDSEVGLQVKDLLGFAGDTAALDGTLLGAATFAETVHKAMEFVRTELGGTVAYHDPGDLIEEEWLPGFRIYVLGPPRNEDLIKDLGKHGSSELYGVSAGLRSAALLHLAASSSAPQPLTAEERGLSELELPFDSRFNRQGQAAEAALYPDYIEATNDWRKLKEDWLNLASDLALQLDSMTNNSSLALAIERVADGKVLLFPADAQQGNWLSWHAPEIKWSIDTPSGVRTVTAADLLSRTVFYKVGHHASHNATARGKGLELMEQQDDLVAFIPVDRAIALKRNPKDSWQMPARPLYRELLKKCQGRVARSDTGWAAKAAGAVEKEFIGMATDEEWNQWAAAQEAAEAADQIKIEDLYIEYLLK